MALRDDPFTIIFAREVNLLVRGGCLPCPAEVLPNRGGRIHPGRKVDIRIVGGRITAIEPSLDSLPDEEVLEAATTVVIPGLHDHHLHLRSLAASRLSVLVGPAQVSGSDQLAAALSSCQPDSRGWRRAIGYHELVAGDLDRWSLDELASGPPMRVQHRTGVMWIVSSSG